MNVVFLMILFAIGLILIVKGGDIFVDASIWMADVSGIPKFIIGATIVSVATTLPELLVSIFASFDSKVDIAIGNAVGSVTANTGLILAISMICLPSIVARKSIAFKSILLILSAGLLFIFSLNKKLELIEGVVLLILFALNMLESIKDGKAVSAMNNLNSRITVMKKDVLVNGSKFFFGVAGIIIGADLLVDYGSELARHFGVSEAVIGATLIAVGTSLPELVTTITAITKKQAALSIGNVIGANVIDLTLILPLCTIFSQKGIPVIGQNLILDIPACFGIILMAIMPILMREKYTRLQGGLILLAYMCYTYLVIRGKVF